MEIRPPEIRVHIPIMQGKRRIEIELRSRGEARALIAAIAQRMDLLRDDAFDWDAVPPISLPASWLAQVVDAEIVPWTLAELIEDIAPMSIPDLREIIADAHDKAPLAVESAVSVVTLRREQDAAPRGEHPYPEAGAEASGILAESIRTGVPVVIEEDIPACGGCGHAENQHHRKSGEAIAHGRCWILNCGCEEYTLPDRLLTAVPDAAEAADPGYLEDAAAQDEDEGPACADPKCGHGKLVHYLGHRMGSVRHCTVGDCPCNQFRESAISAAGGAQ